MPELGPEDFFIVNRFKAQDEAIFAARIETNNNLQSCNQHARTERLLERAGNGKATPKEARARKPPYLVIDR